MRYRSSIYLWKRAPFIRLVPPLVLGIIAASRYPVSERVVVLILSITVLLFLALEFVKIKDRFRLQPLSGLLLVLIVFIFGILLFESHQVKSQSGWYGNHLAENVALQIEFKEKPQEKPQTFKAEAEIRKVFSKDSVFKTSGKAVFYFYKDDNRRLRKGDVLFVGSKLQNIPASGNPGSFDYSAFMARKQIFHQAFLAADDWVVAGQNRENSIVLATGKSAEYIHSVIDRYINGPQEIALAKALLTGDKAELDPDLVQAYRNTGVVHIMAISGLHLGLIYIFLLKMCNFIPGIKRSKYLKFTVILAGIWFFALMTGSSPSVLRAAVMFSFLAMSILKNRKVATYNFWAASGFILLCINPMQLFHVGFQLSYLAVLGILVLQRPIYKWIYFQNRLIDYVWQLISVTLAAQLFTLPLILYYFHQFPTLFIFANLLAIPLASAGLWLGVVLILVSPLYYPALIAGYLTAKLFGWLNGFIQYISEFRYSVWDGFFLTEGETLLLSVFIVFVVSWFMYKSKISFYSTFISLIALVFFIQVKTIKRSKQNLAIFYNIPYSTAIDFISSDFYFDIGLFPSGREISSEPLLNARKFYGVKTKRKSFRNLKVGKNELYQSKKSFLHITESETFVPQTERVSVDYIVLSNSPAISIKDLNDVFEAGLYIFMPSNRPYLTDKWKSECDSLLLRSHTIASDGALVLNY